MTTPRGPLPLQPIYKKKVWGGRRLETRLGKRLPSTGSYGEAWEVADLPEGATRLAALTCEEASTAALAGKTLSEANDLTEGRLLGRDRSWEPFPLLFKFIDAADDLSVQVHPDDSLAKTLEGEARGKTECWLILDAPPGSFLYAGLTEGVTPDDFFEVIHAGGAVEPLLRRRPVNPGDVVPVPAGTIHAITAGILLAEIQQSSDYTYRLYDWGRPGLDGRPRPLHLERGRRALTSRSPRLLQAIVAGGSPCCRRLLALCEHFALEEISPGSMGQSISRPCGRFEVVSILEGSIRLLGEFPPRLARAGTTWLVPSEVDDFGLEGTSESARALRFYVPTTITSVLTDFGVEPTDERAKGVLFQ